MALSLRSQDEKIELNFSKGILARTKEACPLKAIKIDTSASLTPLISNYKLISPVYELSPEGATFSPTITLTFYNDIAGIPADIDTETLHIVVFDNGDSLWKICNSQLNKVTLNVSTEIERSGKYALVGMPKVPVATTSPPQPAPAAFTISNLEVRPILASPGEAITISTKVSNTGGTNGEYNIVLSINHSSEMAKNISLEAGAESVVEFSVNRRDPGNYMVNINNLISSFTIEQLPPATTSNIQSPVPLAENRGINWFPIGITCCTLLIAGVLITLTTRKKQGK